MLICTKKSMKPWTQNRILKKGTDVMKDYQKPEFEIVSLIAQEKITNDDYIDGEMGLDSSIFD